MKLPADDFLLAKGRQVVFYSVPNNPDCTRVRQFLLTHGALFTEVDVTQSAFAAEQLIRKAGSVSVPVVEASGLLVRGFDENGLRKALAIAVMPAKE